MTRKKTKEEIEVSKNFQEINEAARQVIRSINILRRSLTGSFITPEIDRELKTAQKAIEKIRNNSTDQKATSYLYNLKNA